MRDVIRKEEKDYKLTTQNNTVEYVLKPLEPGGRYSVSVRLRNMSKEASFTLSTGLSLYTTVLDVHFLFHMQSHAADSLHRRLNKCPIMSRMLFLSSPSYCAVPLPAPEALKILTENDHVFLFWKSLAVREKGFDESRVRHSCFLSTTKILWDF